MAIPAIVTAGDGSAAKAVYGENKVVLEVDGRPLVLVRQGERVHALDDACPHAGAPLSEGFVEGAV